MSTDPNTFNTNQIRDWQKPQHSNSAEITVPFYITELPIGLNQLDVDRSGNVRIKSSIDNFNSAGKKATVHLDSWHDTQLYSAGCTWLDIARPDRDFQFGTFAVGSMSTNPKVTSTEIKFEKPYAVPPKVVVWLNNLDMDKSKNWRIKAYAEKITANGFTLHVTTWGDTILYHATATWISHPSNRPNIASGVFNTVDIRAWDKPQHENNTKVTFDKKFERTPQRVLVALNSMDIDCEKNLRIKTYAKDITAQGMTLSVDSWFDTKLYSGGASYLAIQDY